MILTRLTIKNLKPISFLVLSNTKFGITKITFHTSKRDMVLILNRLIVVNLAIFLMTPFVLAVMPQKSISTKTMVLKVNYGVKFALTSSALMNQGLLN